MEAQSNLIPESASIRYSRVWADFSAAVECGEAKTLSSYCRLTHTSYEGIKYWIRSGAVSQIAQETEQYPRDGVGGLQTRS